MRFLTIEYNKEFISNRIKDELLLVDIWNYTEIEKKILIDIETNFNYKIEPSRNINTLSGGQRSIAYLVTLSYIILEKKLEKVTLNLVNITQSLSPKSREKLEKYLNERGIYVA